MKRILDFFSSVKLTLSLLLGLALVAVGGTIWPVEQGMVQRFELYYQSLWFRLLLGMLAANLAACTWRTWRRVGGEKDRFLMQLQEGRTPVAPIAHDLFVDPETLIGFLADKGYRATGSKDKVLLRRGLTGRWALPVLHLAILAIMLGALASQLGFVGTMRLYVTHQSDQYFDWSVEKDQPLGFTLRLDHFEPQYYPIELRFSTYDRQTRQPLMEYTTKEGEIIDLSSELSIKVERFFPEEQHLVLGVIRQGVLVGEYHSLSGDRSYPNSIDLGVDLKATAFRDPVLKQLRSEVTILEAGQVVNQGMIKVNQPLVHRGVAIYQTAYLRDESGFWNCGFQLSKDPGEPLMWAGCLVLIVALALVFTVRFCAVGVVSTLDGCKLIPLAGFRGAAGQKLLSDLIESFAGRKMES